MNIKLQQEVICLEFQVKYAYLEVFISICEAFSNNIVYYEIEGEKTVESLPDDLWQLQVYLEDAKDFDLIKSQIEQAAIKGNIKISQIISYIVEERDWVSEVQKNFIPINSGRFFIHNSEYNEEKPNDKISIQINAGRAFGTGEHETTSNCLKALSLLNNTHFDICLDMGCGSAILAIAMAKLWVTARVIAVDIDEQAVEVTKENCQLNQVNSITSKRSDGYDSALVQENAPYQLITANILAAPLIAMARDAYRYLIGGGYLILAGFINSQLNEVLAAHIDQGFVLYKEINGTDWPALIMHKPKKQVSYKSGGSSVYEADSNLSDAYDTHPQQVINPYE